MPELTTTVFICNQMNTSDRKNIRMHEVYATKWPWRS